jgi:GNAT superfamily N-acetyltransferase
MSTKPSSPYLFGKTAPALLRNACPADVAAITTIFLEARAASMAYVPTLYSQAEIRDWVANDLMNRCKVTVACVDRIVAGFTVRHDDWLEQLYIHPEQQGRGIGALLVEQAKRASSGTLRLHVFQPNLRARHFYARHGFTVESLRDKSQNEEQVPDMVCLWRAGS